MNDSPGHACHEENGGPDEESCLRDPVCGMSVTGDGEHRHVHGDETYYFCSAHCLRRFIASPAQYLERHSTHDVPESFSAPTGMSEHAYVCPMCPEVRELAPVACPSCGMALKLETPALPTKTQYTCPMHPEVVRDEPGDCPICGMALEPMTVTVDEEANPELADMARRFFVSAVLAVPLVVIAMGEVVGLSFEWLATPRTLGWVELALGTPVVLWGGWPFFVRGWQSVVNRSLNMFTLIGLGTGVAYGYSVVATLAPGAFPASFRDVHGEVAVYFEAAAVIVTLVLLGQVMELRARSRTGAAIRALLGLAPKTARRVESDGSESDVPLDQVQAGDRLRVRPGEKVPVDGVLFKDAEAIEVMRKVDTLVVDKTGTLTEGRPKLVLVEAVSGVDEATLLRLAATIERGSEHPLAEAIVAGANQRGIELGRTEAFDSVTGKGVTGEVDGKQVALGNLRHLEFLGIEPGPLAERAESLRTEGQTVMFVAVDGKAAGMVSVADPIKETTPAAIEALHGEGLRIVMLTGDSETTARAVAAKLGLDGVVAGVLPDQKAETVRRLQEEGHVVGMAGDGINDAPALAQAQVGIAMGTGTDVAMESAGVTLVRGDLRGIVRARRLSRATMRNIRQNLFFAFVYNLLGVPIAAGVLYLMSALRTQIRGTT